MVRFSSPSGLEQPQVRITTRFAVWHTACSLCGAMRRIIVVRRGDEELFDRLRRRYAADPETVVRYDRRTGPRRRAGNPTASERRRGERRLPHDIDSILATRGYFVVRAQRRRSPA